jgi:hypothetical protein
MSKNPPFGMYPNLAILELARRERERLELFKSVLTPSNGVWEQLRLLEGPLKNIIAPQDPSVALAAKLLVNQYTNLISPHWARAIQNSALEISRQNQLPKTNDLFHTQVGVALAQAAKALHDQRPALTAILQNAKLQEQFKEISSHLWPSLERMRLVSNQMAMFEGLKLRLSEESEQSIVSLIAQDTIDAQQILGEIEEIKNEAEVAQLIAAFISIITSMFAKFRDNTVDNLKSVGLASILGCFFVIHGFLQDIEPNELPPEQQSQFREMLAKVDAVQSQLKSFQQAEDAREEAYLSTLPKAELAKKSNIRANPRKDAPRILVTQPGTMAGVIRTEGRWKLIVVRDPLTDQLLQGWVFGTSVTMLQPTPEPPPSAKVTSLR